MPRRLAALAASSLLFLVACGDDDDSGGDGADLEAYCELSNELDAQEEFPSEDQLEELRGLAPTEIRDAVDTAVDAFLANPDNPEAVFEDPDVGAAFEEIEPFEEENCA